MKICRGLRALCFLGFGLALGPGFGDVRGDVAGEACRRPEEGHPYFRLYTPREMRGNPFNLAIIQDQRGVVYSANFDGVREYDGTAWRTIPLQNYATASSLAMDDQGVIYVGGLGEVGYLAPDAAGTMRYVSLTSRIAASQRRFSLVTSVFSTPEGVYFISLEYLFRWSGGRMKVWPAQTTFLRAYQVRKSVFVWQENLGLCQVVQDQLQPTQNPIRFAREEVRLMLPLSAASAGQARAERTLIGTLNRLMLWDGRTLSPFPTEVDDLIQQRKVKGGYILPDGAIVLRFMSGGLATLDQTGRRRKFIDKSSGLPEDVIQGLTSEAGGGLWLATTKGVCHVETPSPLSVFEASNTFGHNPSALQRFQGVLYLGTFNGAYYLDVRPGEAQTFSPGSTAAGFRRISGIVAYGQDLLPFDDVLLCTTEAGICEIRGKTATLIPGTPNYCSDLERSRQDPSRVFVGLGRGGVATMCRRGGRWVWEGEIPGTAPFFIFNLLETNAGELWLGAAEQGVVRVSQLQFGDGGATGSGPMVEHFGRKAGLPAGTRFTVHQLGASLVVASHNGLYRFEPATRRFVPDPRFDRLFPDGPRCVQHLAVDTRGWVWLHTTNAAGDLEETGAAVPQAAGGYRWVTYPFRRFSGESIAVIYPEADGVVWFGGADFLARYDPRILAYPPRLPSTLIRRVSTPANGVLFGGAWPTGRQAPPPVPSLAYADNNLRFEFTLTAYDREEANRFQFFLEGFDQKWSGWTAERFKEYSNLTEGSYAFHVRGQDVYGHPGREDVYRFTIRPPWHRTGWAYAGYAVLAVLFMVGLVRANTTRLRKAKNRLEQAVAERTTSLRARTEELESLDQVVQFINRETSPEKLLGTLLDQALTLVPPVRRGFFYIWNREQAIFRVAAMVGVPSAKGERPDLTLERITQLYLQTPQPSEEGVYVHGLGTADAPDPASVPAAALRPVVALPIPVNGELEGVMVLEAGPDGQAFGESDVNRLRHIRSHAVSAFLKSRIVADLQEALALADRARAEADRANKAKSEFLSSMSHELRTPLNAIIGFSEVLLEQYCGALNTKQEEYIRDILVSGRHLLSLINDILDLTKIEAGRVELRLSWFNLRKVLSQSLMIIREQCLGQGIAWTLDVPESMVALEIEADLSKVNQILYNLLNNAVKFSRPGGAITLSARFVPQLAGGDAPGVEIAVADQGIGIAKEDQERVFEMFYQASSSVSDRTKGVGLGLAIVKRLVELHQGRIWLESEGVGKGARFVVSLPMRNPGLAGESQADEPAAPQGPDAGRATPSLGPGPGLDPREP